ncbi:MAG: sulfite oxidase heme-binding subunit YedZ [Pseudomonadota bacterium]
MNRWLAHPAAKPVLWTLLALPLAWLVWGAVQGTLGPNPAEALIRSLGDWTLRGLVLTLAISPLRDVTGWHQLLRHRRAIGVATFIYATLHWLAYAWLDQGLDLEALLKDVAKRPFILVGTLAWLLLLPLAATSFNRAIKALGAKRWQALHKAIYAIALLAILHFFWMRSGKQLYGEVAVYAVIVFVLLAWRVRRAWRSHASTPPGQRRKRLTAA